MKFRLFGFAVLAAINIYVAYSLWDTLLISILPICLIMLSVICSGLFLINVRSKLQRAITYFLAVTILLIGLFFCNSLSPSTWFSCNIFVSNGNL